MYFQNKLRMGVNLSQRNIIFLFYQQRLEGISLSPKEGNAFRVEMFRVFINRNKI